MSENTEQNGHSEQLQPITAPKRRSSRKTPVLQQAVIANALLGANNSQIAKDLNINRSTVKAILSSADIEQHILQGRSDCIRMIPRSIRVIDQRLRKGSETAALSILKGTQVLVNQQVTNNQTNIHANSYLLMVQAKQAESGQVIEVSPNISEQTTTNSDSDPKS